MKIKTPIDNVIIFFILIQSLLYIFFFPNLENPDGMHHYQNIFNENQGNNLYYILLSDINHILINVFQINDFEELKQNAAFNYFNWENILLHDTYNFWSVMLLQIVNVLFIMLTILIFHTTLKLNKTLKIEEKKMFFRVSLLYFLYPAVSYLIVGITPDFPGYLYQPFFVLLLYLKRHIANLSIAIFLFLCIDDGTIINVYFIFVYVFLSFIFKLKLKNKYQIIFISVPVIITLIYFVNNFILIKITNNEIYEIMKLSQESNGTLYTKVINFVMSSFYFLGSGSYITFPPLYLLYGVVVLFIFYRLYNNKEEYNGKLFTYIVTGIITVGSIILLFPPYSHIRFFLFSIILLLLGLFSVVFKDKYILSEKKYLIFSLLIFMHNTILIMLISIKTFIL